MEHKSKNNIIKIITLSWTVHVFNYFSGKVTPNELRLYIIDFVITHLFNPEIIEIVNMGPENVYDLTSIISKQEIYKFIIPQSLLSFRL